MMQMGVRCSTQQELLNVLNNITRQFSRPLERRLAANYISLRLLILLVQIIVRAQSFGMGQEQATLKLMVEGIKKNFSDGILNRH
jgi:hypothetical protein